MTNNLVIAVTTQPICLYCHRLYSPKHGKYRQKCCNKKRCLERYHRDQVKKDLAHRRQKYREKKEKGPDLKHFPMGQECKDGVKFRIEHRPNPFGHRCHNPRCGKIIQWTYRNGELWDAPRYYCSVDVCQNVREWKAVRTPDVYEVHNRRVFPRAYSS